MTQPAQIGLLIQTNWTYGRGIFRGLIRYANLHQRWTFHKMANDGSWDASPQLRGIIGHITSPETEKDLRRLGVPIIDVSALHRDVQLPRVIPDNLAVGRIGAEHLLAMGHRQIAFIGNIGHYNADLRADGFKAAADNAGVSAQHYRIGSAAELAAVIAQLKQHGPLAGVMCANDQLAGSFSEACAAAGMRVPDDIAIVGVDNDDIFCELAQPSLSSIELGTERIGHTAGEVLARLMAGEAAPTGETLVPPIGVVRRASSDTWACADEDVAAGLRYIRDHVQEGIQVKHMLAHLAVSRRTLERRFLEVLGRSPAEEIRRIRIERVCWALANTSDSLALIAKSYGFINAKELSKTFRRQVGQTPTAYRAKFMQT